MLNLDITHIVTDVDTWALSGSVATHGADAGPATWRASLAQARETPLLTTPEHFDDMRAWVRGFGDWSEEEIAAWSEDDCNAFVLQYIAGNMREMGLDDCDLEDFDWAEYEQRAAAGQVASDIYRADDGRVWIGLE